MRNKTQLWLAVTCVFVGLDLLLTLKLIQSYVSASEKGNRLMAQGAEYARILDSDRRCREQSALLKQAVIEVESLIETEATGSDSNPGVMAQDAETCQFKLASAEADLKYTLSHIKHLRFQVVQKQQETAEALNLADAISRLRRVHLNELRSLSVADLRNELISDLSHVVVEGVTELQALTDKELTQMARQHFLVKINPGIV